MRVLGYCDVLVPTIYSVTYTEVKESFLKLVCPRFMTLSHYATPFVVFVPAPTCHVAQ